MLHDLKIVNNGGTRTQLVVDGVDLSGSCTNFVLSQKSCDLPKLHVDLFCDADFEVRADLKLSRLDDLARIMDKDLFKQFCAMWHGLHDV